MNTSRNQGLPKEVQENIIHNIRQLFPNISRELINGILVKEEWDHALPRGREVSHHLIDPLDHARPSQPTREKDVRGLSRSQEIVERSLRFLHTTLNSFNNAKANKNKQNKTHVDKSSMPGTKSTSKPQNKPDLFQKAPNAKQKKMKHDKIASGDWVMINKPSPEQNGPKVSKKKKNTTQSAPNVSKEELMMKVQVERNANTTSSLMNKQARRTALIKNFGIIKHFGDPTNRILAYIKEEIKVMIILRGCSGSGKSTFAQQILMKVGAKYPKNHVFSSDNFFIRSDGRYYFNAELLQDAHEWNQKLVRQAASEGRSPIFVDNTNSRLWEMREYAIIAVQYGYILETLEPPTPWFFNEDILVRKSSHATPRETIRKMLDRYEANLTGEDVIKNLQLSYVPPMIPPQGVMAGINSPISKKHSKMLKIPINIPITLNISNKNSNTLKTELIEFPEPNYPQSSGFDKDKIETIFSFDNTPKCSLQDYVVSSGSGVLSDVTYSKGKPGNTYQSFDLPQQLLQDSSNPLNEKYEIYDKDINSKESSSDFLESESEETDSDTSSSSVEEESDLQDSNLPPEKDEILEYVLISENNLVIFQREHDELKDVKTLDDFKKIVSTSKIFPKDFENYLLKYMESSGIKQESEKTNVMTEGPGKGPAVRKLSSNFGASLGHTPSFQTPLLYPKLPSPTEKLFDSSTNTNPKDFEILEKVANDEIKPDVQIFEARPNFKSFSTNDALPFKTVPSSTAEQCTMTLDQELEGAVGGSNSIDTLHSLFPDVSKQKLIELFGTSLHDIDWAIGLLLDSGQKMTEFPKNKSIDHSEGVNVGPRKDVSITKEKSSCISDSSTTITKEQSKYIGDWDYKRELPKVLPKELPKHQRESRSQFLNLRGVDIATNTNYADFEMLREVNTGSYNKSVNAKILVGNHFFTSGKGHHVALPPAAFSVLMLEKGTMTSDFGTNRLKELDSGIERLAAMFPRVSRENLEELFEKCQKDIDWAAGLLLDSGQEMSELFTSLGPVEVSENEDTLAIDSLADRTSTAEPSDSCDSKPKKKKKIRVSKSDNELYKEMQQKIQNNFVLDESHYSSERMRNYFQKKKKMNNDDEEKAQSQSIDENNEDINNQIVEQEDDIVFMMDSDLVLQLQARFGGLLRPNMIGERTVVSLPLGLARQLHSYVMDSIHKHIEEEDIFPDEDEEYARHLQEEETRSQGTPSLLQIMDEEVALRKYHKDSANGRSMASALSKQLLIERFPKMDPSTLATILEDTNHSLHQASCLLSSAGHEQADVEDHNPQASPTKAESGEKFTLSREEAIRQADAYGDVASQLYEMRKDCLRKSQKAYREGNHSVALYYSDMARWYMERIEKSNSLAAKAILTGYEGWTTLDLHFLQVSEALNILDLFVDEVIRDLQESNKKRAEVFIITGRGLHSAGGKPKLKPAVQSRLFKRELKFHELNPGMLRVIIPRTALTSYKQKTSS